MSTITEDPAATATGANTPADDGPDAFYDSKADLSGSQEGNGTAPADGSPGDPQDGLFDKVIEDDSLEALLDKREALKAERKEAQAAFKAEDDLVKARLSEFELEDGEVARVGKYRIAKKATASRSVSFETSPSSRLTIGLFDPDND